MNSHLTTINFHGATLIARRGATPAETLVAMKPVAEGMGLSWQGQHAKLTEHPVLSEGIKDIVIPSEGGPQAMTALPLSRLNFWLATIHPNKVPDLEARERIIRYQRECADALFAHFFGKVTEPFGRRVLMSQLRKERRKYEKATGLSRRTTYRHICERYGVVRFEDMGDTQIKDAVAWLRGGTPKKLENQHSKGADASLPGTVRLEFSVPPDKALRILAIVNE
ncbi:phage antirepressor N-terminal domain-containing protein [Azospirillum doebereinerae]